MKLSTKFSVFNALSRVAILLVLVGGLPLAMSRLARLSTDQRLGQKKEKVLKLIRRTGITAFIEGGQSSYGSYNLLKEEFISLETIVPGPKIDVIEDSKRAVEDEIVQYRVLSYSFAQNGQHYLLEIGRSTGSIGETEGNFRRYAFYILLVAVVLTTLADLAFFRYLLAPFYTIIRQRLKNSHYPPAFDFEPVATGTDDFRYLDESLREMMATIQASFTKERKFIADASHELLTPLAALQYRFDNMLADEGLSEENQLRVVDSQRTVHRLRTIIKSLLLISKIENDQFVRTDTVSLAALVAEVGEEVQDRLAVRRLFGEETAAGRGLVQAGRRFAELVGQRRRDAVRRLEERERVELVEVADDEGHRHRLADRPAEAEHDAADDAGLGVRQHDPPDHFPRRRA